MRHAAFTVFVLSVLSSAVLAGPFVSLGPFVPSVPGHHAPPARNWSGKEYTARIYHPSLGLSAREWDDLAVLDPLQGLWWDGEGGITDAIDYDGFFGTSNPALLPATNVDAQSNPGDVLFGPNDGNPWLNGGVINNRSFLAFSVAGDGRVLFENRGGGGSVWAVHSGPGGKHNPGFPGGQIDQHALLEIQGDLVFDLDSLELGGVDGPLLANADAFLFSLEGDPADPNSGARTSVWDYSMNYFPSGTVFTAAQIASFGRSSRAIAIRARSSSSPWPPRGWAAMWKRRRARGKPLPPIRISPPQPSCSRGWSSRGGSTGRLWISPAACGPGRSSGPPPTC